MKAPEDGRAPSLALSAKRTRRLVFAVLMTAALIAVLAILPYAVTLVHALPSNLSDALPSLWVLLPVQVLQSMVLVGLATGLGLWLGPEVGLGAPLLSGLLAGDWEARARLGGTLLPAAGLGALVGGAIVALDLFVFAPQLPETGGDAQALQPPVWQGLMASLYGAVPEELMLRLGVMTLLVWLGARVTRNLLPPAAVYWSAIVVAALLFGAGHLPTTAAVLPLTPLVVVRALVLNGLGGVVFGWLYWRWGLLAAMVAHFGADLVLHVVTPLMTR